MTFYYFVTVMGAGEEVHHPTLLRSINLSQPSSQLHQRRVRDRVRDRDRLSVKQLAGELLHRRRLIVQGYNMTHNPMTQGKCYYQSIPNPIPKPIPIPTPITIESSF